ncbi:MULTISPECIES: hydantoinase B/oxoprolinase family protein [unclassified Oceanobacter]|uniref:hydantoinase B/oxoprolinase family protein n=2 Tax=Gammaproteobacteria TaxID=1236 RepID=UPI002736103F|nr:MULTISPECIES: hydantoinase B/oxoprolinase family protein [unclassified Oceanobacter]MDP2608201.1 hydantoinase B/oxoprolinase family protein [Oceanobacter sp. 1_MG-2023]MDP2612927.1 hydantoinase B/oxoprolinase family protein [Oceanobacter sp. 2_MG-2023]
MRRFSRPLAALLDWSARQTSDLAMTHSPIDSSALCSSARRWQFWVDRGGTFTDLVALRPDGQLVTHKLLSENPDHYDDAAIEGIRQLLALYPDQGRLIGQVKMGTTVATNALLERKGAAVALFISRGLRDQLQIGYQTRPDLFAVAIEQPEPLYQAVYEVPERILASGQVDWPLDLDAARVQLQEARDNGIRAVAVVLMHAYKYPQHELALAELALALGFEQISLSHQVSPLIKLVARGETTLANAYLTPVLQRYLIHVEQQLQAICPDATLSLMQSNGGLAAAALLSGKDAVLSGPAGGVVGMVRTASADGFERLLGFDMGGTSTDVSHFAGELERETSTRIAGVGLRVPMMNIHTVAAGGGSIVKFADGRLQVGPESAGANPGPACYRNGGPLTVTDCNVLLGRIQPQYFPSLFGPNQDLPLDVDSVRQQFQQLALEVSQQTGQVQTAESLAQGFLAIAVDNMASAAKKISVQRGYDVRDYALVAFGGAGAQHACQVAEAMGVTQVYLHPMAGVLSAYGIGVADQRWLGEQPVEVVLAEMDTVRERVCQQLSDQARQALPDSAGVTDQWRAYLRYQGADTPLLVTLATPDKMTAEFTARHRQLFGFAAADQALICDAIQLERIQPGEPLPRLLPTARATPEPLATIDMVFADGRQSVTVYPRARLPDGFCAAGPLLLTDSNSTLIVEPGWVCKMIASGALVLEKMPDTVQKQALLSVPLSDMALPDPEPSRADPVQLEVFNNLFMAAAEQMGLVLEKTASSVNIKERLDFSCAIFDRHAELIANAPHIPVHLGSMSDSVLAVVRRHPEMEAGDAFVLNSPYEGGTHLPDITVVKPVFIDGNRSGMADFFVAARGHHADIGGITPGSMPANSQHIEEEGVLIDNLLLMRHGVLQTDSMLDVLTNGRYPARNPAQNMADLKAQLAACETGARELARLCQRYGRERVHQYMGHVLDNAEDTLRACLAQLPSGQFEQQMDDGTRFAVTIKVDQQARSALIDFTGTGYRPDQAMHPGNFNAPTSVVRAAVLYVFRVLVARPIPLNAGLFRALTIRVPEASIIAPCYPAAVVSGNVETAQYLVDTLMGALQLMAACQGTNNNLTFGNKRYQYYETLCGGAGGSASGDGASAVHSHMTNSRLTDPEVLEQRYPVVLDHFHLRRGSGGAGQYPGGMGVERHIRFLEPMTANIISGRRQVAPFGIQGGDAGRCGVNLVMRGRTAAGEPLSVLPVAGCARLELQENDTLAIHTPGGGGYGTATVPVAGR